MPRLASLHLLSFTSQSCSDHLFLRFSRPFRHGKSMRNDSLLGFWPIGCFFAWLIYCCHDDTRLLRHMRYFLGYRFTT